MTRWRARLIAFAAALGLVHGARAELAPDIRAALERAEFARAIELLQPLAQHGDVPAQLALAALLRRGQGIPLDHAAAAHWYRKAADQGDATAQNALGALYASGLGVAQDQAQAFDWYQRAAVQGAAAHQFDLALMYDNGLGVAQDFARAALWYAKAAEQGYAAAEANLAFLYQQGAGVPQDFARALALYTRAAHKGDAKAQNNLGLMYTRGEGVAQDYAAAVEWYRRAARQDFAKAITNLGVMYENGFGVRQDEDEARRLYRLGGRRSSGAAEAASDQVPFVYDAALAPVDAGTPEGLEAAAARGEMDAQFLLAWRLAGARDFRAAAHWFRAAAEQGQAHAMTNLGLLYLRGLGVPQDHVLAHMWTNLAAARGIAAAAALRDMIAAQLTAAQANEAQRLARDLWARSGPANRR